MKKIRNRILTVLAAVLVLGLLVWRLWPRSLESLSGLDFDRAVSLMAHTRTTVFESGTPITVSHKIAGEDTQPGTEHFEPLLELFRDIEARPSLSNLLRPWPLSGFSWTGPVDFLTCGVSCGDSGNIFEMTDRGELMVGGRLYFITDDDQFNALWEYVTTHGAENKS